MKITVSLVLSNIIVMANSGTLPFTFTTWLSVWDIVYDWLLESIIGSYFAFMLTCGMRATHTWFMFVFG